MELLLLEILRIVSLTVAVLMIPFEIPGWEGVLLLFYTLGVCFLFLWRRWRKRPVNLWMVVLLLLPLSASITVERTYFYLIFTGVVYLYFDVRLGILDPQDLSQRFKISYGLLLFSGVVAVLAEGIRWILLRNLSFLLLYFFSTILLSASMRHKEAGVDPKRSRSKMVLYLFVSLFAAVLLGSGEARRLGISALQQLGSLMLTLLSYLLYPIAFVFYGIFSGLRRFFRPPDFENLPGADPGEGFQEEYSALSREVRDLPMLKTVLSVLLLVAALYLLYRFFRRKGEKPKEGLAYIEEREYLKDRKARRKRIKKEEEPEEAYEKLRYRYRTYLAALRNQMEIRPSDTAADISDRAKKITGQQHERIRDAYQEARYGAQEVTEERVREFMTFMEETKDE